MSYPIPASAREAAQRAAQAKLAGLAPGQTGINLANEIADAILDAAYPHIEGRFLEWEADSAMLAALHAYGVDNWDGYSDALDSLN
jgi:hypothetical protein